MNIILFSNRLAKTRSITLGVWQAFAVLLLSLLFAVAAVIALQSLLARFVPETLRGELPAWVLDVYGEQQRQQQRYVHSSLDALAGRIGQMQSEVQRLDALGERLAKLAGIKSSEFRFDQPPAQGGPLLTLPPQKISIEHLQQQLDQMSYLLDDRGDKLAALQTILMQNELSSRMLPSVSPIKDGWYSSNFGWRADPLTGENAMHEGVDFMAVEGTPIYASAGGVVSFSDKHPQYGNMVEIDHGKDILTRYAHASRLLVKVGQVVRRGEKIAEVGSTGRSTGNHLHFEVRYRGSAQNPVRFLQKSAG